MQALAGGAAEQAAKSLTKFNIHEKIGAGHAQEESVSAQELESYGITEHYVNKVSALHFSTFRDYPAESLLPLPEDATVFVLNAWQLRHAQLICHAVKEMGDLRFMLCPKYMKDERFWHIYFSMLKPDLPPEAFLDAEGGAGQPAEPAAAEGGPDVVQGVLQELKSTWHALEQGIGKTRETLAAHVATATRNEPAAGGEGLEMGASALPRAPREAAPAPAPAVEPETSGLVIDPDLEAYLQVEEGDAGDEGVDLPDMDFDDYLNELTGPEVGFGQGWKGVEMCGVVQAQWALQTCWS